MRFYPTDIPSKRQVLTLGAVLGLAALTIMVIWGWPTYQHEQLVEHGQRTTAQVVAIKQVTRTSGKFRQSTYDRVTVSFTVNGKAVQHQSNHDFYEGQYKVGEEVEVFYNPASPNEFVLVDQPLFFGFGALLTFSVALAVVGAVLIALALGLGGARRTSP